MYNSLVTAMLMVRYMFEIIAMQQLSAAFLCFTIIPQQSGPSLIVNHYSAFQS